MHANVQCIRNKFLEIEVILREGEIECLCVNEHWLVADEFSAANLDGYTAAVGFCRSVRIHGGVGIYIGRNAVFRDLNITRFSEETHCEAAGVYLSDSKCQLITVYRSPTGDFDRFLEIVSRILDSVDPSIDTILTGDFNVHFSGGADQRALLLNNLFHSYGMSQTLDFGTRYNNCIDNIFTTFPTNKFNVQPFDLHGLSDHTGVLFECMIFAPTVGGNTRVNYRPITEEGLFMLYNTIEAVDWNCVTAAEGNVDARFQVFSDIIADGMETSFPIKSKLINSRARGASVNWFNDRLREMRERLRMINLINKQNPVLVPKQMVTDYKRKYRLEVSATKKAAYDDFVNRATNRQSAMWNIIKTNSNSKPPCPPTTALNSESFNNFFINIAEDIVAELPHASKTFEEYLVGNFNGNTDNFKFKQVSYNMVRGKLCGLKNSKSRDCYGLNAGIIKTLKNLIIYPLTNLINLCISENTFPSNLKVATVIPIFKNKGSTEEQSNYRPISLLPIFSKILESLMKDQISAHFEHNNLFTQSQFGFRNKKSTTLAIDSLTCFVAEGLERGLDTYASFFDLTKAFDCVCIEILLNKLTFYNFHPDSIAFVKSYLSDRTQYVSFNGSISGRQTVRRGVPQGSVLGPLLFLVYINDLPGFAESPNLVLFADDTTSLQHYHPHEPIQGIISNMQLGIQNWFLANKLSLNNTKTQHINFSLRNVLPDLPLDGSVKFLGVYLDPGLTWSEHITQLASKLSRITFLIRSLARSVSRETLMLAYHGYFSSNMSYAVLNWGHSAHAQRIFGLQRRCVRIIAGLGYRDCCRHCFCELQILTFPCVFILHCLKYLMQNISSFITHRDLHEYPTRNNNNIVPGFHRLARTRRGSDYYGIIFYNVLPLRVRELGLAEFVRRLKAYLIVKSFYSLEEYLSNDFSDLL